MKSSKGKSGSASDGGQTVEEIRADRKSRSNSDSSSSGRSVPGGGPAGSASDGGQTIEEMRGGGSSDNDCMGDTYHE